jgi:hypothetical protein
MGVHRTPEYARSRSKTHRSILRSIVCIGAYIAERETKRIWWRERREEGGERGEEKTLANRCQGYEAVEDSGAVYHAAAAAAVVK